MSSYNIITFHNQTTYDELHTQTPKNNKYKRFMPYNNYGHCSRKEKISKKQWI